MGESTPVRELCREHGLTQRALATRFGIPIRTVEQWCTGKRKCPEYVVQMMTHIIQLEAERSNKV